MTLSRVTYRDRSIIVRFEKFGDGERGFAHRPLYPQTRNIAGVLIHRERHAPQGSSAIYSRLVFPVWRTVGLPLKSMRILDIRVFKSVRQFLCKFAALVQFSKQAGSSFSKCFQSAFSAGCRSGLVVHSDGHRVSERKSTCPTADVSKTTQGMAS